MRRSCLFPGAPRRQYVKPSAKSQSRKWRNDAVPAPTPRQVAAAEEHRLGLGKPARRAEKYTSPNARALWRVSARSNSSSGDRRQRGAFIGHVPQMQTSRPLGRPIAKLRCVRRITEWSPPERAFGRRSGRVSRSSSRIGRPAQQQASTASSTAAGSSGGAAVWPQAATPKARMAAAEAAMPNLNLVIGIYPSSQRRGSTLNAGSGLACHGLTVLASA